jgi:hypothetical protein
VSAWDSACTERVHARHEQHTGGPGRVLGARVPGVVVVLVDQGGARRR